MNTVRALFRADVISITNPMDLGVLFDFDIYAQIVEGSLKALSPDAVLLINTYGAIENESGLKLAKRVGEIMRNQNLPIALCLYADAADLSEVQEQMRFPVYEDINTALRGLASSRDWHFWSQSGMNGSSFEPYDARLWKEVSTETLLLNEALSLCEQISIPTAKWEIVQTPHSASEVSSRIGFPVALKLIASNVSHKSDIGGVEIDLLDAQDVSQQASQMLGSFKENYSTNTSPSLLVQEMIQDGVEVLIGGKIDPTFGPVVTFGLGGIHVELFNDVSFRVAPISGVEAHNMIDELRGKELLNGFRGGPVVDREAIVSALLSISDLLVNDPRVVEFEINPLITKEKGVFAVDARGLMRSQ
jgi:acetyltransferase